MQNSLCRQMLVLFCRPVVLATCLVLALAESGSSADRAPVPAATELKTAQAEIKELFKADLAAAKSGAQLTEVAERMLANVQNDASSSVNDYVLLTQAQAAAVKASNVSLSRRTISLLAERYQIDEHQLSLQMLKDLAKGPLDPQFHQELADLALQLSTDALQSDRLEIAGQYLDLVSSLATKLKSVELSKRATARRADIAELRKLSEKLPNARAVLEKNATDAAANDVVGRYALLAQRDWKIALPLMMRSSDSQLRPVAERDWNVVSSDASFTADEAFSLASDWWELSQKQSVPALKSAFKLRAGQWYEFALPELKALSKTKAEQRLAESEWKGDAALKRLMPLITTGEQVQAALLGLHGWSSANAIICQTAKFDDAIELTKILAAKQFRATRFRPYPTADGLKVAALWVKDGVAGDVFVGTTEQVLKHDKENRSRGFVPEDVAGFLPKDSDGAVKHVLVSARRPAAAGQEFSLYLDAESKGLIEKCKAESVNPLTFQRYLGADNKLRTDMVCVRVGVINFNLRTAPLDLTPFSAPRLTLQTGGRGWPA